MSSHDSNQSCNLLTLNENQKQFLQFWKKIGQKWIDYVNSCNESERRDLSISCNSVLKIIQSMNSKTDIQLSNNKSYEFDRLRNLFDIRNKDPVTLTIYQRE